jgi:hypothetical protein
MADTSICDKTISNKTSSRVPRDVQQYAGFAKALLTFEMSHGFTTHAKFYENPRKGLV